MNRLVHAAPTRNEKPMSNTQMTQDAVPVPPQTLAARLTAAAVTAGAAPSFIDRNGVLATHHDLQRIRDGGRVYLRELGVEPHDRVAIVMAIDWRMAAALVTVMSACVVAPLDPHLTDRELDSCFSRLRPKVILADEQSTARLRRLVGDRIPVLDWQVATLDATESDVGLAPQDSALLLFTSGTTGRTKIAQLTQQNALAGAESVARTMRLSAADRALNTMPLHHAHGILTGLLAPLLTGGSTVCGPLTSGEALLDVVGSTAPTWYSAAPVVHHTVLAMIRSQPEIGEALRLRAIRSTSSALPVELLSRLEEKLAAPVVEAYALTEAPGQVASNPLDGPRKPGSVGRPQDAEIILLGPDGELTDAPGSTGEVLVRSANVSPGYLDLPPAEQPFVDGWLRTGDQGIFDEDGYLTLTGRTVNIINRGGEKISPTEVEAALTEHPAVREAAAFGRPHPTLGEVTAAAVVLHEQLSATEDELKIFAGDRLAAFKVPVQIHFLPALPRNSVGKVLHRRLKELTTRPAGRHGRRRPPSST
ncbi:AMP-binding protein [Micromonospora sp. NPDC000089]|uniref:AMP-binding protein n=1 Tax=unclassified Micromonospora TaxID=2617518 RepID=UPI0036756A0B